MRTHLDQLSWLLAAIIFGILNTSFHITIEIKTLLKAMRIYQLVVLLILSITCLQVGTALATQEEMRLTYLLPPICQRIVVAINITRLNMAIRYRLQT